MKWDDVRRCVCNDEDETVRNVLSIGTRRLDSKVEVSHDPIIMSKQSNVIPII